jgi:aminocarboxymuconate-semialdehyde decarboxylase
MSVSAGGLLVTRLSPASAAPIKRGADVRGRSVDIHAH